MDTKIQFQDNFSDIFMDASYRLHELEMKNIDGSVKNVIYSKAVFQKIFPTNPIPQGLTSHRFYKATEPRDPIISRDFKPEAMEEIRKTQYDIDLIGISLDYFISMVDIDASRHSQYLKDKIDTLHVREITAKIADVKEQILWRGESIANIDPDQSFGGLTGVYNDSNVQTADCAPDSDDDYTTAGDLPYAVGVLADKLLDQYFMPPYELVWTPSVYGRSMINQNSTTHQTDLERIRGLVSEDGTNLINSIHTTPHLGNGTDEMCLIKTTDPSGGPTAMAIESYPLWHYPINTTSLGIQGKVLWLGAAAVTRPNAIATVDASMTV